MLGTVYTYFQDPESMHDLQRAAMSCTNSNEVMKYDETLRRRSLWSLRGPKSARYRELDILGEILHGVGLQSEEILFGGLPYDKW